MAGKDSDRELLFRQKQHWENTFLRKTDMFGRAPSDAAVKAAEIFKKENKVNILELGGGQGRDTMYFGRNGFHMKVLDYCRSGVEVIAQKVDGIGLSDFISAECHDIRNPLPFNDETFDGCYSHMLYCMALTTDELEFLTGEIMRVLKPGGLNIYTVRHTGDAHYGTGVHRGENMYEVGGFIVHFFSEEKVRQLAGGFKIVSINEFEEGGLPRKLFRVTLKKNG